MPHLVQTLAALAVHEPVRMRLFAALRNATDQEPPSEDLIHHER
jgi:hypothetical protein